MGVTACLVQLFTVCAVCPVLQCVRRRPVALRVTRLHLEVVRHVAVERRDDDLRVRARHGKHVPVVQVLRLVLSVQHQVACNKSQPACTYMYTVQYCASSTTCMYMYMYNHVLVHVRTSLTSTLLSEHENTLQMLSTPCVDESLASRKASRGTHLLCSRWADAALAS